MHDAERRLRWRGEAVIASASSGRPAWELVDELAMLGHAALAVAGCGLAGYEVVESFLVDIADALVVRGADWLTPTFPALPDVSQLYNSLLTAGSRQIGRDPAVKTVGGYLDGLVAELVERVRGEGTFEAMVEGRRQVAAAVEVLGAGDGAVRAFDDALVAAGMLEREA